MSAKRESNRTRILKASSRNAASRAAAILHEGGLVAFPTETVYGLGADATNPTAVARIFEVKHRPHFDPLIIHLADADWLKRYVETVPREAEWLAGRFWPGPLTIVLPKRSIIPDIVTSGLSTVAVRVPSPAFARSMIAKADVPVAAPSANQFGRISPTTARAVNEELGGKIDLIVDAGRTLHGIESTVVGFGPHGLHLLRPGPITREELSDCLGREVSVTPVSTQVSAPGQLQSHYAPVTPLRVIARADQFTPPSGQRVGLLAFQKAPRRHSFEVVRILSERGDLRQAAANLFAALRRLDNAQLDLLVAEAIPLKGLGLAIMDRLRKAAASKMRS